MSWVQRVRRRQSARRRRFFAFLVVAIVAQTLVVLLGYSVARFMLGIVLSPSLIEEAFAAMVVITSAIFAKLVSPLPFKGAAPEEAAAQAFFAGEDVRSDDHEFEKDLKP